MLLVVSAYSCCFVTPLPSLLSLSLSLLAEAREAVLALGAEIEDLLHEESEMLKSFEAVRASGARELGEHRKRPV